MELIRVRGRSMLPALRPADVVLACAPLPWSPPLHRGSLLVLEMAGSRGRLFIKRLIGLPGERVETRGGRVWIDGKALEEPYVGPESRLQPQADRRWTLGEGDYVVLGDARDDSLDSRSFGLVHPGDIQGVVKARIWPWPESVSDCGRRRRWKGVW